jgi:hypothetical protein
LTASPKEGDSFPSTVQSRHELVGPSKEELADEGLGKITAGGDVMSGEGMNI